MTEISFTLAFAACTPGAPPAEVVAPAAELPAVEPRPPTGRTLRALSLAIRDQPPSLEEARAFSEGTETLDDLAERWLASDAHRTRMERYFSDFFGLYVGFTPFDALQLVQNEDGVYRLAGTDYLGIPGKPDCTLEESLEAPAWWVEEGQTIRICPSSASDRFVVESADPYVEADVFCNSAYSQGLDPRCGCGPYQLLCVPCAPPGVVTTECVPGEGWNREIEAQYQREATERGLYVYAQGGSWFDFLGGDFFYGRRPLYYAYLQAQGLPYQAPEAAEEAIAALWSVPMDVPVVRPWPAGPERAGVVTSPGYLDTFNTFRGRARILSQVLLCHDVDASLNPDGYATFLNPEFTEADRAHGERPECAGCHYGMDNQATMLFGYDRDGTAQTYLDPFPSQVGHVFGEDAAGPSALVAGYLERAEGVDACLASSTWAALTGLDWEQDLDDAERAALTSLASAGPRALVEGVLRSPVLREGG